MKRKMMAAVLALALMMASVSTAAGSEAKETAAVNAGNAGNAVTEYSEDIPEEGAAEGKDAEAAAAEEADSRESEAEVSESAEPEAEKLQSEEDSAADETEEETGDDLENSGIDEAEETESCEHANLIYQYTCGGKTYTQEAWETAESKLTCETSYSATITCADCGEQLAQWDGDTGHDYDVTYYVGVNSYSAAEFTAMFNSGKLSCGTSYRVTMICSRCEDKISMRSTIDHAGTVQEILYHGETVTDSTEPESGCLLTYRMNCPTHGDYTRIRYNGTIEDGFAEADGQWCYFTDNWVDTSYTDLAEVDGEKYYVKAGVWVSDCTSIVKTATYGWVYVKNGIFVPTYTGLAKNSNGWFYIKEGKVDWTYTGLAKNSAGWFFVNKGKLDRTYSGLAKGPSGWYYVKYGKLDLTYTGLAKNSAGWFYVKKGKLDRTYTGLAKNSAGWFYVTNGKYDPTFTGLTTYNSYRWYVKAGKLQSSYTGIVKYSGSRWYVKYGKVQTSYTGTIKISGVRYRIKAGKVV